MILATPNGNMLWTCDYKVINQLLTQPAKVQIPTDLARFWDVWGPTVASVEGEEWKTHRRGIEAGLSSSINPLIWTESQRQSRVMIDLLVAEEQSATPRIMSWTSRLALHVIAHASFGMRLDWTSKKSFVRQARHLTKLPFDEALPFLVQHMATVFVIPRSLLRWIPFDKFRDVCASLDETERHIRKLQTDAKSDIGALLKKRDKNVLEAIVASGSQHRPNERNVTGDLFFTLLAGFETVGTVMGFILIFCAIYPDVQQRIQDQLDKQLGDRPPDLWTLEHDYPRLNQGYMAAVQKEVMSLYQPASFLWRRAVESTTVIDSKGVLHPIPPGTLALLNTSAANKNPIVWEKPCFPSSCSAAPNHSPALYFNPDRWLGANSDVSCAVSGDATGGPTPNWMGFGLGPRSCPGRAFAQVEMAATLATLLKGHTLELVVSSQTLSECDHDERRAWQMTQDAAIRMMFDDIEANFNIGLAGDLPIRIVKRATRK